MQQPPDDKYNVLIERIINHKIDWNEDPPRIYPDYIIPKAARPAFFAKLLRSERDVFDELKMSYGNYHPQLPPGTTAADFDDIADVFEEIESDTNNTKAYQLLREAIIGLLYAEHAAGERICTEVQAAIRKYPERPDLVNALERICADRHIKTIHNTY